ncbi:MAG: recombinase family protein, partial [Microcystis sp. LE19-196.1B]|nr:recombinase family protein [Microcystis sp. LE19-196.1B]
MSTPEQLKGDSVRRQQKATDDYIREMGWELTDIIQDHGVSAFKGKNVEFGALAHFLRLAELGMVDAGSYLIVESLDRLTRQNVFEAISLLNRIIRLGVNVVTLIDRRVYSKDSVEKNEADLMIASITMMRAHEESRTKSIRLSAAWEQKRKSARSGSVTKQKLPHWLKFSVDGLRIEVIEDRASIIREIFELSRDGWGSYSIAKHLNQKGIETWGRSTMWQESYVKKLLDNRSLLGEYQPFKTFSDASVKQRVPDGEPVSGYYPAVIDEVLYTEARESKFKRRTSGAGRKGLNYPNLFTGTLECGYCGSGMRFIDKGQPPKGAQYLRCSKAV